jgi:pyridoxine 5-phosphate synthase
MSIRLHVNIDHVATLRNARGTSYPDPVDAARVCIDAGADGITAHLREDRRHIRDEDVQRLRKLLRSTFNLEMAATDEMVGLASRVQPDVVTLVPERREERTTEGGLDVVAGGAALAERVRALHAAELKVSLFIAPEATQVAAAKKLGVEQIELHTGEYCHASGAKAEQELARLAAAARAGSEAGLEVAAGHGLTQKNVVAVCAIPQIVELNIGHAIVADAVFLGLPGAVRAMRDAAAKGVAQRPR